MEATWRRGRAKFPLTDDPSPGREAQIHAFLRENGLRFPVVIDDGTASAAFSVSRLPTMMLLDRTGQIIWIHVGSQITPVFAPRDGCGFPSATATDAYHAVELHRLLVAREKETRD